LLVGVVSLLAIPAMFSADASGADRAALVVAVQYAGPAVLVYSAAYLIMNLGAFIVAIEVEQMSGTSDLRGFAGLGSQSPFMATAMTVFMLGLGGIPLTAGFIGKLYLFGAAVAGAAAGYNTLLWVLAGFGVANSVVSIFYYFRIVHPIWLQNAPANEPDFAPGVGAMAGLLAVLTVGLGIFGQGLAGPAGQLQDVYSPVAQNPAPTSPTRVSAASAPGLAQSAVQPASRNWLFSRLPTSSAE